MPDIDASGTVIHFCNQTEVISLDVEDGKPSNAICGREILAHILKTLPPRSLCQPIPDIQRSSEFRMLHAGFEQLSASNDVQERTPHVQNVRKKRNCQEWPIWILCQ